MIRIGHGYDAHRFLDDSDAQSFIVLGGCKISHPHALLAHSDGDVLIHALTDAILGALALGDIGKHFPDSSAEFKNIDSRILLRNAFDKALEMGYSLGNTDITIVAQAPKMAPHIQAMRENIAADLQADLNQINVKATTTEKMGFTGRKEGIAVHTVVLLNKTSS